MVRNFLVERAICISLSGGNNPTKGLKSNFITRQAMLEQRRQTNLNRRRACLDHYERASFVAGPQGIFRPQPVAFLTSPTH
ncbi:hypothetical protein RSAG8_07924, partial [Rhizoctonia solani AG-8 WAC10335]